MISYMILNMMSIFYIIWHLSTSKYLWYHSFDYDIICNMISMISYIWYCIWYFMIYYDKKVIYYDIIEKLWYHSSTRFQMWSRVSADIWKPDHLARFSIWEHILLRCTLYIMSYTMLQYNSVWKSRKSYISWYTRYISRHTIGQKYISVYTEIYFWQIVYLEIYDYTCNSVYVRISQYEILR